MIFNIYNIRRNVKLYDICFVYPQTIYLKGQLKPMYSVIKREKSFNQYVDYVSRPTPHLMHITSGVACITVSL